MINLLSCGCYQLPLFTRSTVYKQEVCSERRVASLAARGSRLASSGHLKFDSNYILFYFSRRCVVQAKSAVNRNK